MVARFLRVSIALMKLQVKDQPEKEWDFASRTSSTEARTGTYGMNLETETGAEAMRECCLLAHSLLTLLPSAIQGLPS